MQVNAPSYDYSNFLDVKFYKQNPKNAVSEIYKEYSQTDSIPAGEKVRTRVINFFDRDLQVSISSPWKSRLITIPARGEASMKFICNSLFLLQNVKIEILSASYGVQQHILFKEIIAKQAILLIKDKTNNRTIDPNSFLISNREIALFVQNTSRISQSVYLTAKQADGSIIASTVQNLLHNGCLSLNITPKTKDSKILFHASVIPETGNHFTLSSTFSVLPRIRVELWDKDLRRRIMKNGSVMPGRTLLLKVTNPSTISQMTTYKIKHRKIDNWKFDRWDTLRPGLFQKLRFVSRYDDMYVIYKIFVRLERGDTYTVKAKHPILSLRERIRTYPSHYQK